MQIGVLNERKIDETRVALLPEQARKLVADGHRVRVEKSAGVKAGFSDDKYIAAGASVESRETIYDQCELLLKIKCPLEDEYAFLKPQHTLFAYLHFDENIPADKLRRLIDTGFTGIAYEWVEREGTHLLLTPMSDLTGVLFAMRATDLLMSHKGKILGQHLPAHSPGKAMVIGCGHIGGSAVAWFLRNRVPTILVDKHPETVHIRLQRYISEKEYDGLREWLEILPFDQSDLPNTLYNLRQRARNVDVLINAAVRRKDLGKDRCEYFIDRATWSSMENGSIICDATACDNETIEDSPSSELLEQITIQDGKIFYSPDHIPSYVPATASNLLTAATFDYIRRLAGGIKQCLTQDTEIQSAVCCHKGLLTHRYSAERKGMSWVSLSDILSKGCNE